MVRFYLTPGPRGLSRGEYCLAAAGVGWVQLFGYGMGFLVARIRPPKTSAAQKLGLEMVRFYLTPGPRGLSLGESYHAAAGVGWVQFFGYGMGFLVARIRPPKTSAA